MLPRLPSYDGASLRSSKPSAHDRTRGPLDESLQAAASRRSSSAVPDAAVDPSRTTAGTSRPARPSSRSERRRGSTERRHGARRRRIAATTPSGAASDRTTPTAARASSAETTRARDPSRRRPAARIRTTTRAVVDDSDRAGSADAAQLVERSSATVVAVSLRALRSPETSSSLPSTRADRRATLGTPGEHENGSRRPRCGASATKAGLVRPVRPIA